MEVRRSSASEFDLFTNVDIIPGRRRFQGTEKNGGNEEVQARHGIRPFPSARMVIDGGKR
jgi:hypothetical protein